MKQAFRLQEFANDEELKRASHSVADYLLVIQPHEVLWNEIKSIKEKFATDYSCDQAERFTAHNLLGSNNFNQQKFTSGNRCATCKNLTPLKLN